MNNSFDQKYIEESFQKLSKHYHIEAVTLFKYYHIVFEKKYNDIDLPELNEITDKHIKSAESVFRFTFEQQMEVERADIEKGEQFYFNNEPGLMAALSFFCSYIEGDRDVCNYDRFTSFLFLAEDFEKLSILLKHFQKICDKLEKYVFLPETGINYFHKLELMKDRLAGDSMAIKNRWSDSKSKVYKKPVGFHGGAKTKQRMTERINVIKDGVLNIQKPDHEGLLKIRKSEWEKIIKIFPMTFPTMKKYRDQIERELSQKFGKRIFLKIQKN